MRYLCLDSNCIELYYHNINDIIYTLDRYLILQNFDINTINSYINNNIRNNQISIGLYNNPRIKHYVLFNNKDFFANSIITGNPLNYHKYIGFIDYTYNKNTIKRVQYFTLNELINRSSNCLTNVYSIDNLTYDYNLKKCILNGNIIGLSQDTFNLIQCDKFYELRVKSFISNFHLSNMYIKLYDFSNNKNLYYCIYDHIKYKKIYGDNLNFYQFINTINTNKSTLIYENIFKENDIILKNTLNIYRSFII